jgi:hypothetical protein
MRYMSDGQMDRWTDGGERPSTKRGSYESMRASTPKEIHHHALSLSQLDQQPAK